MLNGGRDCLKEYIKLDDDDVNIRTIAYNTPEEYVGAEETNPATDKALRTMLNHSGAPAYFWAECLYAAY